MKSPQDHRDSPYPLRMPEPLRQRLERAARKEKRSLHAEILHRLSQSLLQQEPDRGPPEIAELLAELDTISLRLRQALHAMKPGAEAP